MYLNKVITTMDELQTALNESNWKYHLWFRYFNGEDYWREG